MSPADTVDLLSSSRKDTNHSAVSGAILLFGWRGVAQYARDKLPGSAPRNGLAVPLDVHCTRQAGTFAAP